MSKLFSISGFTGHGASRRGRMRAESYLNRQPEREVTRESEQARTSVEGARVRVLHHQIKDKESEKKG